MSQLKHTSYNCFFCGNEPKIYCSDCNTAVYCGEKCQLADYKLRHKIQCPVIENYIGSFIGAKPKKDKKEETGLEGVTKKSKKTKEPKDKSKDKTKDKTKTKKSKKAEKKKVDSDDEDAKKKKSKKKNKTKNKNSGKSNLGKYSQIQALQSEEEPVDKTLKTLFNFKKNNLVKIIRDLKLKSPESRVRFVKELIRYLGDEDSRRSIMYSKSVSLEQYIKSLMEEYNTEIENMKGTLQTQGSPGDYDYKIKSLEKDNKKEYRIRIDPTSYDPEIDKTVNDYTFTPSGSDTSTYYHEKYGFYYVFLNLDDTSNEPKVYSSKMVKYRQLQLQLEEEMEKTNSSGMPENIKSIFDLIFWVKTNKKAADGATIDIDFDYSNKLTQMCKSDADSLLNIHQELNTNLDDTRWIQLYPPISVHGSIYKSDGPLINTDTELYRNYRDVFIEHDQQELEDASIEKASEEKSEASLEEDLKTVVTRQTQANRQPASPDIDESDEELNQMQVDEKGVEPKEPETVNAMQLQEPESEDQILGDDVREPGDDSEDRANMEKDEENTEDIYNIRGLTEVDITNLTPVWKELETETKKRIFLELQEKLNLKDRNNIFLGYARVSDIIGDKIASSDSSIDFQLSDFTGGEKTKKDKEILENKKKKSQAKNSSTPIFMKLSRFGFDPQLEEVSSAYDQVGLYYNLETGDIIGPGSIRAIKMFIPPKQSKKNQGMQNQEISCRVIKKFFTGNTYGGIDKKNKISKSELLLRNSRLQKAKTTGLKGEKLQINDYTIFFDIKDKETQLTIQDALTFSKCEKEILDSQKKNQQPKLIKLWPPTNVPVIKGRKPRSKKQKKGDDEDDKNDESKEKPKDKKEEAQNTKKIKDSSKKSKKKAKVSEEDEGLKSGGSESEDSVERESEHTVISANPISLPLTVTNTTSNLEKEYKYVPSQKRTDNYMHFYEINKIVESFKTRIQNATSSFDINTANKEEKRKIAQAIIKYYEAYFTSATKMQRDDIKILNGGLISPNGEAVFLTFKDIINLGEEYIRSCKHQYKVSKLDHIINHIQRKEYKFLDKDSIYNKKDEALKFKECEMDFSFVGNDISDESNAMNCNNLPKFFDVTKNFGISYDIIGNNISIPFMDPDDFEHNGFEVKETSNWRNTAELAKANTTRKIFANGMYYKKIQNLEYISILLNPKVSKNAKKNEELLDLYTKEVNKILGQYDNPIGSVEWQI
jgi:hypothetical protein